LDFYLPPFIKLIQEFGAFVKSFQVRFISKSNIISGTAGERNDDFMFTAWLLADAAKK